MLNVCGAQRRSKRSDQLLQLIQRRLPALSFFEGEAPPRVNTLAAVLFITLSLGGCSPQLIGTLKVGKSVTTSSATVTSTLPNTLELVAGAISPAGNLDGAGSSARFSSPQKVVADASYLYVADAGSHVIRRISRTTFAVETIAGSPWQRGSTDGMGSSARFYAPAGIAINGTTLYVADYGNHTIRALNLSTFAVTTVTGAAGVCGSTNSTLALSRFCNPTGIVSVGTNLYIASVSENVIRKVNLVGDAVTVFAGDGAWARVDGIGTAASLKSTFGLATDGTTLIVSQGQYWGDFLRAIDLATATVSTLNCGYTDWIGGHIEFDGTYVYYPSTHSIRRCKISDGSTITWAGQTYNYGYSNGTGIAAQFYGPLALSLVGTDLFVTEVSNHAIRRIDSTQVVTSPLGSDYLGMTSVRTDGVGNTARFETLRSFDGDSNVFWMVDWMENYRNNSIRTFDLVTTAVGTQSATGPGYADGIGSAAQYLRQDAIVYDGSDHYYVADDNCVIRKITVSTNTAVTWLGVAGDCSVTDGNNATARIKSVHALAIDANYLYLGETYDLVIRRADLTTGAIQTIAGQAGVSGYVDGAGGSARFARIAGLHAAAGALYIADSEDYWVRSNNMIRKMDTATFVVSTIAGNGTPASVDGVGAGASFYYPRGLALYGSALFVAEQATGTIRKVNINTGSVTTVLGSAGVMTDLPGPLSTARLNGPMSVKIVGPYLYLNTGSGLYRAPLTGL